MKKITLALIYILWISQFVNAQPKLKYDWVRTSGNSATSTANSIHVDGSNNVLVAGTFTGASISLGSNFYPLQNSDTINSTSTNFFLAKYNQSGQVVWAKRAKCNSGTSAKKVITDNQGNIYAIGNINQGSNQNDTISFDGITQYTYKGGRSFLVKYSPQGTAQWALFTQSNFFGYDTISSVSINHNNNSLYIGGFCLGDSIIIGNQYISNQGNNLYCSFIARVNENTGNIVWLKNSDGSSFKNTINTIFADTASGIYATGTFQGSMHIFGIDTLFNSTPAMGSQSMEGYVIKFSNNGLVNWKYKGECQTNDEITTVAEYNNRVIIAGNNSSPIILGGQNIAPGNYIAEFYSGGLFLSAYSFPATIRSIQPYHNDKGFIISGEFTSDSLHLGSISLAKHNLGGQNSNIFVSMSDSINSYSYGISAGGTSSSYLKDLYIADSNKIYICGTFYAPSIYFDTVQYFANGISALYLAKIDTGSYQIPIHKFNLGGTVFVGDLPADFAKAYLYDLNFIIIDTCAIDSMGFYNFYGVASGKYKVGAELSSQSVYFNHNYIFTFFPNKPNFVNADTIVLNISKWGKDIHLQNVTSIVETNKQEINLFPNPTTDQLFISFKDQTEGVFNISVYNQTGTRVLSKEYSSNERNLITIDCNQLINGVYFVKIETAKGYIANRKLIISR